MSVCFIEASSWLPMVSYVLIAMRTVQAREVDPDEIMAKDDPEYRRKHAMYVLHVKLGIPLPVIQTHIIPLLYNCCCAGGVSDTKLNL